MLGTSDNFSAVLNRDPLRLAITSSGTAKGDLTADEILEIDAEAAPIGRFGQRSQSRKPSAEAQLHVEIVRARGAGAVLHTHSM
ncbi:MAG: class II aldolase/adducin family protein [Vicinamibacterales bacterium]